MVWPPYRSKVEAPCYMSPEGSRFFMNHDFSTPRPPLRYNTVWDWSPDKLRRSSRAITGSGFSFDHVLRVARFHL